MIVVILILTVQTNNQLNTYRHAIFVDQFVSLAFHSVVA